MSDPSTTKRGVIWRVARRRPWLTAVAVLAVVVLVALTTLHTPPARARALGLIVSRLERAGIVARASRVDYNLLRFDFQLFDLTLATPGALDEPFFSARRVRIVLGLGAFLGRLSFKEVELDQPRVVLIRDASGRRNWPTSSSSSSSLSTLSTLSPGPASPAPATVQRLRVANLDVLWRDALLGANVEVGDVSLTLDGGDSSPSGALRMAGTGRVGWRNHQTPIRSLDGRVSWNGRDLSVNAVRIALPEGTLEADGRIDALLGSPRLDLGVVADTSLVEIARWADREGQMAGTLHVDARLLGPASEPEVTLTVKGREVRIVRLAGIEVEAAGRLSHDSGELTNLTARVADGMLSGHGRMSLGNGPGTVQLNWQHLNLTTLLGAAVGESSVPPLAADLQGSLSAQWSTPRLEDLGMVAESRMASGDGRLSANAGSTRVGLPIDGAIRLDIGQRRWLLKVDQSVAGETWTRATVGGNLDLRDVSRTSLAGTVDASSDLASLTQTLVQVGLFDGPPFVGGSAEGHFMATGTIGEPMLAGTLIGTGIRYRSLPALSLQAQASATRREFQLDGIDARLGTNTAKGHVRLAMPSGQLDGRIEASVRSLAELSAIVPASVHPEGTLDVAADLSGTLTVPRVAATLTSLNLAAAGQRVDRLDAKVEVIGRTTTVESARVEVEGGTLDARGYLDLMRRAYAVHAVAEGLPVHPVRGPGGDVTVPIATRLSGTIDGEGSLTKLNGIGHLSFAETHWAEMDLGRIDADLTAAGRTVTGDVRAPDVALVATGEAGIDSDGAVSVRGRWEPPDVAAVARRFQLNPGWSFSGSAALGFEVAGRRDRLADLRVAIDLDRLDVGIEGQPVRLAKPARLEYEGPVVRARDLSLSIGSSSTLIVDGSLGTGASTGLTAALKGSLADLGFVERILRPGAVDSEVDRARPTGAIDLRIDAIGTRTRPTITGSLQLADGRVSLTDNATVSDMNVGARYDNGILLVESLRAAFNGAMLVATARVPAAAYRDLIPQTLREMVPPAGGPAELQAQIHGLTPQAAAPFVSPGTLDDVGGTVDMTVSLQADRLALDRVVGTVTLDRADLSVSGIAFDQQTPTRLTVHNGRVDITEWIWGRDENSVRLTGGLSLGPDRGLAVTATGALDLRLLNAFTSAARIAGRADSEVRVGGTYTAPTLDGWVTFSNGELRLASPRLIVSDLTGTITLDRDQATLHRLSATMNGGDAEIAGSFRHSWLKPLEGEITLTGHDAAIDISGLRAEADTSVSLKFDPRGPLVEGTVTLLRSAYREPLSLTGGLLAALRTSSSVVEPATPSALDDVRLDVRVRTDEDLLVDNNYAKLAMSADLRLIGTAARPALIGRANLHEGGLVFFGGNRYRLSEEGSIDFVNSTKIEPDIDLRAVTRVGSTDIALGLKGTPATFQTTLTSENHPEYSQSDLVSLLVTGRTVAESGGSGYTPGSEELLGYLSGDLFGAAGRAVGLETFRVERSTPDFRFDAGLVASQTDPGARLTFGRSVGRNVQVVFSQSLRQSGGLTWIVSYLPRSGIELQTVSLDNNDRLYDFRHDLTFGAPASDRARSTPPEAPRITVVRLTGAGADEEMLRSRLKLDAGDHFSFFVWQDDRDRLETSYHERGNLEARVTTRRIPVESPEGKAVELEYDVRPGPRTTVVVEGFSLPGDALAAMKAAWTQAVIDDFLTEEAATIVRGVLVDRGFVLASVVVTIDAGSDEKRLIVKIDPGTHTSHRRVVFRGNQHIPSKRLDLVVADPTLARAAWLDPDRFRDAVVTFYRREGYLSAAVRVAPVTVSGDTATRPVDVDEGEQFHIRGVRIAGVQASTTDDILRVSKLAGGEPFTRTTVDLAREAITADYRKRGFNSMGLTLQSELIEGVPQVDVSIVIEEGPQQRLREIVTTGVTRTRPSLVSRALKLRVGQPVDLSQWNAARRRLYQTGAFRSVDIEPELIPAAQQDGEPAAAAGVQEQPVKAKVTVQEWPAVRLRYGLEVEDQAQTASDSVSSFSPEPSQTGRSFGIGVASDLNVRNLFGRAVSAGLAGRYTRDFRAARAYTTAPSMFGLRIVTNVFLSRSRELSGGTETNSLRIVTDTTGLTLEQRIRPASRIEVAYGFTYERKHAFDPNGDPSNLLPENDITVNVGRLRSTATIDTRNDLVDATKGWFHSSDFEYAPSSLGSDLHFMKYLVQNRYYRILGPVVLASSARFGVGTGFGQELLRTERFFAGGGNSVRGYADEELSPRDPFFGDAAGGNALLVLNQEVRFPIVKFFRGVGFVDAGRAFETPNLLRLSELGVGTGFGLRIQTPVALIRIDFGVPLEGSVSPRRGRWFFSIGQAF